jgi:proteasome lid subunit RPN8/RPN11
MSFFKKKNKNKCIQKRWKIERKCLDMILECAKSNYPNEFGALLRVKTNVKDTISEIVVLPGTISGESHAIFQLHMLPIDFSIVGTVHSHPSYSFHPSNADLHPWQAYNFNGEEIEMDVI